jgi:hypothetical protein
MEKVIAPDRSVGALRYSERPALANLYAVAGRFISVETSEPRLAETFRRYFSGWHVSSVDPGSTAQPDAIIRVHANGDAPASPAHLEFFEVAQGGICHTDESNYFFESKGAVVRANVGDPPVIEVWPGPPDSPLMPQLIFNAAMTAMRRCGLFELHAAGLSDQNGSGLLVIGPSGSGKSTLATQLAAAGWQYLSDDSLLLYDHGERVAAHALRRVFALHDKSFSVSGMARIDSLDTEAVPFDPFKKRFEPHSVFPDQFTPDCVPSSLFFSRLTQQPQSRVQRLSSGDTMTRLIRMCPWACYDKPAAQSHLSLLAGLARQASGFELLAGTDLFNDAEFASRFLLAQAQPHANQ